MHDKRLIVKVTRKYRLTRHFLNRGDMENKKQVMQMSRNDKISRELQILLHHSLARQYLKREAGDNFMFWKFLHPLNFTILNSQSERKNSAA